MTSFRFRWPGLADTREDHPETQRRTVFRLSVPQPGPDWQRPVKPMDPCGSGPIEVRKATTRRSAR